MLGKRTAFHKIWLYLFASFFMLFSSNASQKESLDLKNLYMKAEFPLIANYLKKKDFKALSLSEKILLVECMARTAQGVRAEEKLNEILADYPPSSETFTTAGIVNFSNGRLTEAKKNIYKALLLDSDCKKASLVKIMLHLYFQQYPEAQALYEEFGKKHPGWAKTYLFHLIGVEVYSASRNPVKMSLLYKRKTNQYKNEDKRAYENFKKNATLFQKASQGQTFQVITRSDNVVIPFEESLDQSRYATVFVRIKDKEFKVILDTGNSVGWIIHSRDLNKLLQSRRGGRLLTQIGTQSGLFYGHHIYCDHVNLGDVKIDHVFGAFVPKPHPTFHDANLNPAFIRDRVVTLDFIREKLIIRTKEKFARDLSLAISGQLEHFTTLPWYGYEHAYIPVIAEGEKNVLAMIETGAEDIALRLDFARKYHLPLKPEVKYLATGEIIHYFKSPLKIMAGSLHFNRKAADVWPLDRFYDRITGLSPTVFVGPAALKGKLTVSLNPWEKTIVIADIPF